MANTDPIFVLTPNLTAVTFVNADGTTPKDLTVAGTSGTKVLGISVTSDDTSAVLMKVYLHDGSTAYLVGAVNVPTLSGTNGTAPTVNLLDTLMLPWLDDDGELFLENGWKIQVSPNAAVTAAKTVSVVALAADY